MSSSKRSIPTLQRSQSSSSISTSRHSRLPIRSSAQKNRGKSLSRPGLEKRSLDRNLTRSSSHSNLTESSRLSSQRSSSANRLSHFTPLSQRGSHSARKSPLFSSVRKDTRPITDKKWQNEQLSKVRNYVSVEFLAIDHNSIKPGIALEVFISLLNLLFQAIDNRISITRENYIDGVPYNLKRLRYPVTIKPSLMKTVNAPHSWSQVLGIISWLIDVLQKLHLQPYDDETTLLQVSDDYFLDLHQHWNVGQDDSATFEDIYNKLDERLGDYLNLNGEELETLDKDIEALEEKESSYIKKCDESEEQYERLQTERDQLNDKCDLYENQQQDYENDMQEQQTSFTNKIKKIDEELAELKKAEENLMLVVSTQPYSLGQKKQLTEEIESVQNSINLKTERNQQLREQVETYASQLADLKYKMETAAYQLNNIINQFELMNPELKKLHIRESGFEGLDTEDELKKVKELLNPIIKQSKEDLKTVQIKLEEISRRNKTIEEQIAVKKQETEDAAKLEAELSITLQHTKKKSAKETDRTMKILVRSRNNVLSLIQERVDLQPLQQKLKDLQEHEKDLRACNESGKEKALEFFVKLRSPIYDNIEQYMRILNSTMHAMQSGQEQYMQDTQERLEENELCEQDVNNKIKERKKGC